MLNSYSVKKIMLTVLVLLMAVQVFAQKSTITGVVKNIDGMPIVGAAVQEKGLTNSTITDPEGKFSLQVYDGKALIVKMKGYYTQVIKLEEGTVNLDNIVLVKVERWEFGVLAGMNYPTRWPKDKYFYDGHRCYLGYNDSRNELNGGAYMFFNPCKRTLKIQTLMGLGLTYFSKKINTSGSCDSYWFRDIKLYDDDKQWMCDFSFTQVINTLELSFLIKQKVRVRKSGICLLYGPLLGVVISNPLNISSGNFSELYGEEWNSRWVTYNDLSQSKSGITFDLIERGIKNDYDNNFVLGVMGALGFEHSSGVGVWGVYTIKCYKTQYGWNMRVHSLGAALTYKF